MRLSRRATRLGEDLFDDVRYGLRTIARRPAFALVAICSLALGVGANTAIFSIAKAVLLDPLTVPHPEHLRLLRWEFPGNQPMNSLHGDVERTTSGSTTSTSFSYPVYEAFKQNNEIFDDLTAFEPESRRFASIVDGEAESVSAQLVSGTFFSTFQVNAVEGRTLLPSDDLVGASPATVISDAYWEQQFDRSPGAVGSVIEVNRIPVTIVGVLPATFRGVRPGRGPDLFLPLFLQSTVNPLIIDGQKRDVFADGQRWWVAVMGRIKPRVTDKQATVALEGIFAQTVRNTLPDRSHKGLDRLHVNIEPGNRGLQAIGNNFQDVIRVLMVVVGLLLVLACANLATLLLVRIGSRRRELSVRTALGAQRSRILRQVVTESLLLAFLGGSAGLALGYAGRNLISHFLQLPLPVQFDSKVLGFTFFISLLTGLLFGGFPAWHATRSDVSSGLKYSTATTGRSRLFLGKLLVAVQLCLSVVLLIGAGLFLRTLNNLLHTQLGFQPEHLLLFDLNLPKNEYQTDASRIVLFNQLQTQIDALPGVNSATFSASAMLAEDTSTTNFDPQGDAAPRHEKVWMNVVGTNYFQTMGIPLRFGRTFGNLDSESTFKVAVINSRLAHEFFENENPLVKTFNDEHIHVIGICGDAKFKNLRMDPPPTYYLLYSQWGQNNSVTFQVKTAVLPGSLTGAIRKVLQDLDGGLPITNVRTQDEQIAETLRKETLYATLTTAFGLLAALIAGIGVYGIMAYIVSGRTNEIGIRMALGAQASHVLRVVLLEALYLAIVGIGAGLVISILVSRIVESLLYGLRSSDPLTLAAAAVFLMAIVLAASWIPARRAARVDPMQALRNE
jgi:predicted permease